MRVTFLTTGRQTIADLRQVGERRVEAGNQISSGLRVTRPSDDPSDAAAVVRTQAELKRLEQLQRNLETVDAELRNADTALDQTGDLLTRALSLASSAATSTLDNAARDIIKVEIDGIFRRLVELANSLDSGRFLFAGDNDDLTPFVIDPSSPNGVNYTGTAVPRSVLFPDGRPAQISLPGDEIFLRPDDFTGAGRTPETPGATVPNPPIGIGISFSGSVEGVISTDLPTFFVAAAPPGVPGGGETINVSFASTDTQIAATIQTPPLAGGESTAQIAALLNAQIAATPNIAGGFTFSDEGGALKLVQSDTLGVGFTFNSVASGGLVTGLESGGTTGGQSAEEIATALNAQVAATPQLAAANVRFAAVNGEVHVDADVDFSFTAADFDRGTGFRSGLAGTHLVGGSNSANILGTLNKLSQDLANNDRPAVSARVRDLQRAVDQLGLAQGFYGGTLRQVAASLVTIEDKDVINQTALSRFRDADLLEAIQSFTTSQSAEQATLQVSAQQQQLPNLLDLLA
jgi:flagellin-like hook-associated protein FlgL